MYKNISNIIKQSTNILSDITKNVSTVEKKKSSSFYDDYLERSSQKKNETESAIKNPAFKLPDLTLQKSQSAIQSPESVGSTIKKNIKNVLSKKYGALDTKNLFDDIDDKDVEDNIETAENTIKTNIDRGALNKSLLPKLPNLRDGLALSYAAANKGNNKEATKAREAAYTEDEPLVKATGMKLLSTEFPKIQTENEETIKAPSFAKFTQNTDEVPKIENPVWKQSNETKTETLFDNSNEAKVSYDFENLNEREMPENFKGFRLMSTVQNPTKQDKNKKNVVLVENVKYPKSFYEIEMLKNKENNKHYLHAAPVYPTSYYGRMDETNDLTIGEYSKDNLLKIGSISEKDLSKSEKEHINNWKNLAKLTSTGEMQSVNLNLVDHFIEGTGTDYSNNTLTKAVSNHSSTKKYMRDFSKVFDSQLQLHNGDVSAFADSDDFHTALSNNGVLLSKYSYSGLDDAIGGLEFAIHGWTESKVDVFSLNIQPDGSYTGTLRFTFKDNFGLNDPDVEKYGKYHNGFKSWFILQHYDEYDEKYKPFKTVVEIDYPISGKIEGYKK